MKRLPKKVVRHSGTRVSVTFDEADYAEVQRLARERRVSAAWVVRDAVHRYLEAEAPLFRQQPDRSTLP